MTFKPGPRSTANLEKLDPRLAAVIRLAYAKSAVDMTVTDGLRTHDQHMRNYGKGRTAAQLKKVGFPPEYAQPSAAKVTWVLVSNHESGRACDVYPFYDGKVQLGDDARALAGHAEIARAVAEAAAELKTPIRFGHTFGDRPHYELQKGL